MPSAAAQAQISIIQTRLTAVRAQILASIEGGIQEYSSSVGTRTVRIPLADLQREEQTLLARLGRLQRGRFALARPSLPRGAGGNPAGYGGRY